MPFHPRNTAGSCYLRKGNTMIARGSGSGDAGLVRLSSVIPNPDASYFLFAGFLTHGYHTSLMAAQLPPMPNNSYAGSTYVPVRVTGQSTNGVYVEFGYEEYGSDTSYSAHAPAGVPRGGAACQRIRPFWFVAESFRRRPGPGRYSIRALPGHILYYHVVDGGIAGPLQAVAVPRFRPRPHGPDNQAEDCNRVGILRRDCEGAVTRSQGQPTSISFQ